MNSFGSPHNWVPATEQEGRALKRFFRLLIEADRKNVSTQKATSQAVKGTGLIDKLILRPDCLFAVDEVKLNLKGTLLGLSPKKLKDRKWYLMVGPESLGCYIKTGFVEPFLVQQVITNPSRFDGLAKYLEFLRQCFGPAFEKKATVQRIDLTVDYQTDLKTLLASLDIQQKQRGLGYSSDLGTRTGLQVGKGSEVIVVYDKALLEGEEGPRSRVEVQLKGKKLPIKKLGEIDRLPALIAAAGIGKNIQLGHATFPEQEILLTPQQVERRSELLTLIKHEGLFAARKKLGNSRNFDRDYRIFLRLMPWERTFQDVLLDGVSRFLAQ